MRTFTFKTLFLIAQGFDSSFKIKFMEATSENIQMSLTFGQVFDMIKNLPKKRKIQLFNYLQVDLSAPKKIDIDELYRYEDGENISESNHEDDKIVSKKPLVDYEMLEMLDEIEVEEPEMTDEEFYRAIKEMD